MRAGREKRDLLNRLAPEIERARRLYEERVSPSVGARPPYFQQELVHTLADGDSALLGGARYELASQTRHVSSASGDPVLRLLVVLAAFVSASAPVRSACANGASAVAGDRE